MDLASLAQSFNQPLVHYAVAPFVIGLFTVIVLHRLRLGGLALVAAFAMAVMLTDQWQLQPLTPLRKIALLALVAPVLGVLVDFMARESLLWRVGLALLAAGAAIWVYEPALAQLAPQAALLYGAGAAALCVWLVSAMLTMNGAPARSAGAAFALAGGTAACAYYGGAPLYSRYALALAAGAAAFLLWLMLTNRKWSAGAVLRLPAALLTGLLLCGAVIAGELPWYAAAVLALVPLAAHLPAPERWAMRTQAAVVCLYTFVIAGVAFYTLWRPWGEFTL